MLVYERSDKHISRYNYDGRITTYTNTVIIFIVSHCGMHSFFDPDCDDITFETYILENNNTM